MPSNLFQKVVFTFFTVACSVVVFVVYNQAIFHGSLVNQVFWDSGRELLWEFPIAFLCQLFIAGPLSAKLALRVVDPKVDPPRLLVLTITFMTIALMCPLMSFASTLLYHGFGPEFLAHALQAMTFNFPLAVFSQFFFIGPFVRLVFRGLFRKESLPPGLSGRPGLS